LCRLLGVERKRHSLAHSSTPIFFPGDGEKASVRLMCSSLFSWDISRVLELGSARGWQLANSGSKVMSCADFTQKCKLNYFAKNA